MGVAATQEITKSALAAIAPGTDPRLREVLTALIRHLHDFAREVSLTSEEWLKGIDLLVRAGGMTDDKRNEFILISDVLGLESVVDALSHKVEEGQTESAVLGPFYREGALHLPYGASIVKGPVDGPVVLVHGTVTGPDGKPLKGAVIDVWETGVNGLYEQQDPAVPDMNLRGRFTTEADGRYAFRGLRPVKYPIPSDGPAGDLLQWMGRHPYRPGHIHFIVSAPGCRALVTQIFDSEAEYLESDAVFAVKHSLLVDFKRAAVGSDADFEVEFDIRLAPKPDLAKAAA